MNKVLNILIILCCVFGVGFIAFLILGCQVFTISESLCKGMGSQEPGILFSLGLFWAFLLLPLTMFLLILKGIVVLIKKSKK